MKNIGKNVPCRPLLHFAALEKQFSTAWKQFDFLRADRSDLPDLPDWCFSPLAASYAVISGGGSNHVPLHRIGDVARLGAIAAWRVTQGIYRFDKTLFESIVGTPVEGDLPCELLHFLPEWCTCRNAQTSIYGKPVTWFFCPLGV